MADDGERGGPHEDGVRVDARRYREAIRSVRSPICASSSSTRRPRSSRADDRAGARRARARSTSTLRALLHRYELSNWVLYARAYGGRGGPNPKVVAVEQALRTTRAPLEWLAAQLDRSGARRRRDGSEGPQGTQEEGLTGETPSRNSPSAPPQVRLMSAKERSVFAARSRAGDARARCPSRPPRGTDASRIAQNFARRTARARIPTTPRAPSQSPPRRRGSRAGRARPQAISQSLVIGSPVCNDSD